jgi:hypothetical protein
MPRLMERKDGLYYVRHFYEQNSTWQIDHDGVKTLEKRGVHPGGLLSTDLFMELWMSGMVYVGTRPVIEPAKVHPEPTSPDDRALCERAKALYQVLYEGNIEQAHNFLLPPLRALQTTESFRTELMGRAHLRLTKWKIRSFESETWKGDTWPKASRIGRVTADLDPG